MVEKEQLKFDVLPITENNDQARMKSINLVPLPNFHGLPTEDPNTFLFWFKVVSRTCDYVLDAQKLKLFPSTLKDLALRCFISLEGNNITSWNK